MLSPANDSYLRYPTLHDDVVGFVAQDDGWLAPVEGGRPWQLTSDHAPIRDLRFPPTANIWPISASATRPGRGYAQLGRRGRD